MEKFIPYEKLSKKEKRAMDARGRTLWSRSPVTRKPANPKAYDRRKYRKAPFDGGSAGTFCVMGPPAGFSRKNP